MYLNCRTALLILQVARNWRLMFVIYKILKIRSAINFAAKKLLHHFLYFLFILESFPMKNPPFREKVHGKCVAFIKFYDSISSWVPHALSLSISFSPSFCPKFAWYANLFRLIFVLFFNTYFCVNFIALPTLNTKLDTVKCFDYFCDKISQLRPIVRVSLWEHLTTLLADAEPRPDRVGSKTLWRLPAGTKKKR